MKGCRSIFSSALMLISFSPGHAYQMKDRPLKVLFWVNQFPTPTGWSTLNQIVGFIKHNHEVTILTQKLNTTSVSVQHPEIVRYNIMSKVHVKKLPPKKEFKEFDVILCQSAGLAPSLITFIKKHAIKGKRMVFVRGADMKVFSNSKIRKKIDDSFDLIAPVCEYFKNILIKLKCNKNKIRVLHSSIDSATFSYQNRTLSRSIKIKIITVSRLAEKKGLEYAIEALQYLVKKYPDIEYTIVGEGTLRNTLQQRIHELGLEQHIFLLGLKTPAELVKLLSRSHIFILPSITSRNGAQEGIPNALKEAMAMGLPVISTRHAGIPELVQDGISGFLVPEKNVQALATKIEYLIKYPALWSLMGRAGRACIEQHFERDKENEKLIKICLDLAGLAS